MLLIELLSSEKKVSNQKGKKPINPEKGKLAFPKNEIWHHTLAQGGKGAGWSQIDKESGETEEVEKIKGVSSVSIGRPSHTRDTAPKGVNQKYQTFVKGTR